LLDKGDPAAAIAPFERAIAASESIKDESTILRVRARLGSALYKTGKRTEGEAMIDEARQRALKAGMTDELTEIDALRKALTK
jgi:hypothetical protein